MFVYIPLAHWVWGGGFLGSVGVMDFAGGLVVHLSAGAGGLVAAKVLGRRHGYGSENCCRKMATIVTRLRLNRSFIKKRGSRQSYQYPAFC